MRRFKDSCVSFSALGFGGWPIAGNSYGDVKDPDSLAALRDAIQRGVCFLDTADIYGQGHGEILMGQEAGPCRDKVFLATKAGWDFCHGSVRANFDRSYLLFALQDSLKRLRTDYVDLFQLHNPPIELARDGGLIDLMLNLKEQRKIQYWGVSVHGPDEALHWLRYAPVDSIQIVINLLDQRPLAELLPQAQSQGVCVIAREPLACGMLTGKYEANHEFPRNDHRRRWRPEKIKTDLEKILLLKEILPSGVPMAQMALEFVLSLSAVTVVIVGMKSVDQVDANLRAVEEKHLTPEIIRQIQDLCQKNKIFSEEFYRN